MATRLPALGPSGEGWLVLQVALMLAVILGAAVRVTPGPAADMLGTLELIGRLALIGGIVLLLWASAVLRSGRAFSPTPRPIEGGSMIETGPYRLVRHPIYLGLIVAGLGTAVSQLSLVSLVATAALAVVLDLKRRREEAWLVERFPGYESYRGRTKALIPFVY